MKVLSAIVAAFAFASAFAQSADIAKWDPRMASEQAVVDTNGVKWIDGKYLPIEGRWNLGDSVNYYARLPDNLTTNVNGGVRGMRSHTSGMLFRFRTDSSFIIVKMAPSNGWHGMGHMTEVGTSGWDVYRRDAKVGRWFFVASEHGSRGVPDADMKNGRSKQIAWRKGEDCIINLPLYNGVAQFKLGIAKDAQIEAIPHASGIDKPVVFYGTSITHGGCSTRPGLGFVNIVGRDLDIPVFGLGFSGSGRMEFELAGVIAKIDASCYILDCLWNMNDAMVAERYEPFIRELRRLRPNTPIVMAEQCDVFCNPQCAKDRFIQELYGKLVAEGWKNLVYLPKNGMYTDDMEGTVDGVHPNDLGMRTLATAFGGAVKKALGMN